MNTKINTGGPAFPVVDYTQPDGRGNHIMTITGGMTLRDYFAAKAMEGFNASVNLMASGEGVTRRAAKRAYEIADAMLKAREQ